jgi:hypothetical protein
VNKSTFNWSKNVEIRLLTEGLFNQESMSYKLKPLGKEKQIELWLEIETDEYWSSHSPQLKF